MTMLVQYGVSHMPVHRSAIILLFELVAGAISQQLLTNETMSALEWGGGVLVVAAALLSAWREKT
jgi:drug/metabolite transporter (DMT)-like permease